MAPPLLASVLVSLVALVQDAGDWPQWRGRAGDGLSHDVAWSPDGETRWSVRIGLGYSAPSVCEKRVFTFGFDAERSLDVLRALELETGAELWREFCRRVDDAFQPTRAVPQSDRPAHPLRHHQPRSEAMKALVEGLNQTHQTTWPSSQNW